MEKDAVLKLMQNHVLQLKLLSDRGMVIKKELESLNEDDAMWFESNYQKWLKEQGFTPKE